MKRKDFFSLPSKAYIVQGRGGCGCSQLGKRTCESLNLPVVTVLKDSGSLFGKMGFVNYLSCLWHLFKLHKVEFQLY